MHFPDDREDKMIKPRSVLFARTKWLLNEGEFAELFWDKLQSELTGGDGTWGWSTQNSSGFRWEWKMFLLVVPLEAQLIIVGLVVPLLLRDLCTSQTELRTKALTTLYLLFLPSWISSITVAALRGSWSRACRGAVNHRHDALLGFSGMMQLILGKEPQRLS